MVMDYSKIFVKQGGLIKNPITVLVKHNGQWKEPIEILGKSNATWNIVAEVKQFAIRYFRFTIAGQNYSDAVPRFAIANAKLDDGTDILSGNDGSALISMYDGSNRTVVAGAYSNMFDGEPLTSWVPSWAISGSTGAVIDLGSIRNDIKTIQFTMNGLYGDPNAVLGAQIEVSVDNVNWTIVYGPADGAWDSPVARI